MQIKRTYLILNTKLVYETFNESISSYILVVNNSAFGTERNIDR